MRFSVKVLAAANLLLASTAAVFAAAVIHLNEREHKAQFYFDLGPEQIDVSSYPRKQQEAYRLFAQACSQCHTLARPINSPMSRRSEWERFVARMHNRIAASSKTGFSSEDQARIVDFLVFDAQRRKIGNKDFSRQAEKLKVRFEQVKIERAKQGAEEDQRRIKPLVNENAQPAPRP